MQGAIKGFVKISFDGNTFSWFYFRTYEDHNIQQNIMGV